MFQTLAGSARARVRLSPPRRRERREIDQDRALQKAWKAADEFDASPLRSSPLQSSMIPCMTCQNPATPQAAAGSPAQPPSRPPALPPALLPLRDRRRDLPAATSRRRRGLPPTRRQRRSPPTQPPRGRQRSTTTGRRGQQRSTTFFYDHCLTSFRLLILSEIN